MINIPSFAILIHGNDVEKVMLLPSIPNLSGVRKQNFDFLPLLEHCALLDARGQNSTRLLNTKTQFGNSTLNSLKLLCLFHEGRSGLVERVATF